MSQRFDQSLQDRPLRSQGEQRSFDPSAGHGDLDRALDVRVELHARSVIARAGFHFADCSCGWFSTGYPSPVLAEIAVCEVEERLAVSAERRRRWVEAG